MNNQTLAPIYGEGYYCVMNSIRWKKPSLDDPIQFIKGVGPKKALLLQKLELEAIEDFLYFLPFRYEDRSQLKTISNLIPVSYTHLRAHET